MLILHFSPSFFTCFTNTSRLSSVNYGGGDAGGGNETVSYTYTTFNDFTVSHINYDY